MIERERLRVMGRVPFLTPWWQVRGGGHVGTWALVVSVIAVGWSSGCARGGWVKTHPDIVEQARQQPSTFVKQAYGEWSTLEGLVGSYSAEIRKGLGGRHLDLLIYAQRPGLLRVEIIAPTGSTQALLISGSEDLGLWSAEERTLYRGSTGTDSFELALGLALTVEDAVGVLLGYGVENAQGLPAAAQWDAKRQRIRVQAGQGVTAWLHPLTLRFDHLRYEGSGAAIDIRLSEWLEAPAPVPQLITVTIPNEDLRLQLRLSPRWVANPQFTADDFRVWLPDGSVELPLETLAREGGLLRRGLQQ
ncbi:MAG: hypothetical protein ACE5HV_15115 [Acidobacteriota bacterium]